MPVLNNIQKAMIRRGYADVVRSAVLNESDIDTYRFTLESKAGITSAEYQDKFGMSVQAAGAKLMRLVNKGYLFRTQKSAKSGGVEYIYKAVK